uniref:Solute carrier family 25 member 11 n=1 Tax=Pipistrellus kuhlii TaxID=59472 RepID=A0A7J7TY17_PIPKU|nr:solute carrier family 25 member 11 [Pipistrellus kuhlii]
MAATASPGAGGMDGKPRTSPKSVKFLFGGLAGMGATVFVQPLDLVKNRMQLSGEGAKTREYKTSFHALTSILKAEGLRGIYTGLSAGLLRQATYTTTRLGIYTVLFERLTGADGTPPGFLLKALIGMTAGATGAFVGTPAEVALIRMTADGRLPADQRRGYKNVFNALVRIAREECGSFFCGKEVWSALPLLQLTLLVLILTTSLSLAVPWRKLRNSLRIPSLLLGVSFRTQGTAEDSPSQ